MSLFARIADVNEENKVVSGWLLNFLERRKAYFEMMEGFSELSATEYTGMPHGTDTTRPTERKGITLSELEQKRLWIMTIEDTEKVLSEKKRAFLDIRRRAETIEFMPKQGRPGWVDYVQARFAEWHERRYGRYYEPTKQSMFDWWHDIVNIAARIAIRRGCL